MRFDDTLETVLAGELNTSAAKQSMWRQLVDLIGRRRVPPDMRALALLRRLRGEVPPPVRAASARGLEYADPPAPLVRLLALDEIAIALPVLRSARMNSAEWVQLLPDLAPAARSVLRNRRDLSPVVRRALESYGPIDFVLPDESIQELPVAEVAHEPVPEMPVEVPEPVPTEEAEADAEPVAEAPAESPIAEEVTEQIAERGIFGFAAPELEPAGAESALAEEAEILPEPAAEIEPESEPELEPVAIDPAPAPAPLPPEQLVDWTDVLATPAPRAAAVEDVTLSPAALTTQPPVEIIENASEMAPSEPDFSFVALAESTLIQSLTGSKPANAIQDGSTADQSGTVGAETPATPIAQADGEGHGRPMSGDVVIEDAPAARQAVREAANANEAAKGEGPFEIAEVVARIDAFWANREAIESRPRERKPVHAQEFRFETDAKGVIRWVEGASRAPIVGLSLDMTNAEDSHVDGVAAGAFRRRAGISNARMSIEGDSDAAGAWLISAIPVFDPASGRFTGYRGTARRPRADERAEPVRTAPTASDSLRQLVHELRTPTNAIAGFAEMIETQMLGPVSDPYRDRATTIRAQARELLGAIDDLDLAARIDSAALALVPGRVALRPVLVAIADDLSPLAAMRGSYIALPVDDLAVTGDRRAVERLLARLMATLVSASAAGERVGVRTAMEGDDKVAIVIDRPAALADYPGDSVLGIDDEREDPSLLGTGFALRLARNLARELGGSLVIEPESLTLRLPAAVNTQVEQAHLS